MADGGSYDYKIEKRIGLLENKVTKLEAMNTTPTTTTPTKPVCELCTTRPATENRSPRTGKLQFCLECLKSEIKK